MRLPPGQWCPDRWSRGHGITAHSDSGQLRGLSSGPLKGLYITVSAWLVPKLASGWHRSGACGTDRLKEPGQNWTRYQCYFAALSSEFGTSCFSLPVVLEVLRLSWQSPHLI